MKISNQFILRNVADEYLLIPVGEAALSLNGLIAMSESGALLFEKLKNGCTEEELVTALTSEYEVTEQVAKEDIKAFLAQMRELRILVED